MNVLLIQNDPASSPELTEALAQNGYEVLHADSTESGLRLWRDNGEVGMALTSWNGTGVNAPQFCRQLREGADERDAYIVLYALRGSVADRVAALHCGADDFVELPVDAEELRTRLAVGEGILKRLRAMRKRALTDDLTGLRNRRAFEEDLRLRVAGATRHQEPFGLILVDVARFKTINDQFGHEVGDRVLRHVAAHLIRQVRDSDDCFRTGGDEFGILLYRAESAELISERIARELPSLTVEGVQTPLSIELSMGAVTRAPNGEASPDELLQEAVAAINRDRQRAGSDEILMRIGAQLPGEQLGILVAEDDEQTRTALEEMLRGRGYEVLCAEDGEDAWHHLDSTSVSFVITGWMLPGLDGLQLCRRIRTLKRPRYTYVILLTDSDRDEDIVTGLTAGADDYLPKPFTSEELLVRVRAGERVLRLEDQYRRRVDELEETLDKVQQLEGLLPICAYCKKVKSDENYWQQIEAYIASHSRAKFSHGICPECFEKHVQPVLKNLKRRRTDEPSTAKETPPAEDPPAMVR